MKALLIVALALGIAFMASPRPTQAVEVYNLPIVGAVFGAVEAPMSFFKNQAECPDAFHCINVPENAAKGFWNGLTRIVATTLGLGLLGVYDTPYMENGPIAKNRVITNVTGWVGVAVPIGVAAAGVGAITPSVTTAVVAGTGAGGIAAAADAGINGGGMTEQK